MDVPLYTVLMVLGFELRSLFTHRKNCARHTTNEKQGEEKKSVELVTAVTA